MGDSFEVVVDVDAMLDQAPRLDRMMIDWLTIEGIIEASPTSDRDVWGAGYYLPGPNHRLAAAHKDDPYTLAFARSRLGRLEVTTGRSVFYPTQGKPGPAVCPLCGYAVTLTDPDTGEVTDGWQLFDNALADWCDDGPGTVICPNNDSAIAINEWQGDWPIAVGHLGSRSGTGRCCTPTSWTRSATTAPPRRNHPRQTVGRPRHLRTPIVAPATPRSVNLFCRVDVRCRGRLQEPFVAARRLME